MNEKPSKNKTRGGKSKKLRLNKETVRDLVSINTDSIKGGGVSGHPLCRVSGPNC